METLKLFETPITYLYSSIDINSLLERIYEFQKKTPVIRRSSVGGYQGYDFEDDVLFNEIKRVIPQRQDKPIKSFQLQSWININGNGAWNDIHCHQDDGVLLSGCLYLKCPENSGGIRFYDPRAVAGGNYAKYYNEREGNYIRFSPSDGLILFFPPYLHHLVEPNQSNENRVSIAFNICDAKF